MRNLKRICRSAGAAAAAWLLAGVAARAETQVVVNHNDNDGAGPEFAFPAVPPPSAGDAAAGATFTIVSGRTDPAGGGIRALNDGLCPDSDDAPGGNFFFAANTGGGQVRCDLGRVIRVKQVNSYSWHRGSRGPQVYKLYGAGESATNLRNQPGGTAHPIGEGWKLLAEVDTRGQFGVQGGQYGVSVRDSEPGGTLGRFRYLLFDMAATETNDPFGNTFYSEIDVVDADAPVTNAAAAPVIPPFEVKTSDGKAVIVIRAAAAPDLADWARTNLAPVLAEWYPRLVAMLPSPGFEPATRVTVVLKPGKGVAATSGDVITANANWVRRQLHGEAVGAMVHEAVHVAQALRHTHGEKPGWLVEGTADYLRFFKFEPSRHGADMVWLKTQRESSIRHDGSYRITANFLNWVAGKYDADIAAHLNAAMRMNEYTEESWRKFTGKPLADLAAEWKKDVDAQLGRTPAPEKGN